MKVIRGVWVPLVTWAFFALHDLVQYELILKHLLPGSNQYNDGLTYGATIGFALGHCLPTVLLTLMFVRRGWHRLFIPLIPMLSAFVTLSANSSHAFSNNGGVLVFALILAGVWGIAYFLALEAYRPSRRTAVN